MRISNFLGKTADITPRTLCAFQPVAALISSIVAPPSRSSKLTSIASFVPARGIGGSLCDTPGSAPRLAMTSALAAGTAAVWDAARR